MSSNSIKYQIFISSTYEDLVPERTSVIETILRSHHFPVGMEMFNANNKEQWQVINETIDSSDIYVLIVGHMYGSLTKDKRPISFTKKEFDYAMKRRLKGMLRILCFIRERNYSVNANFVESDPYKIKKLNEFLSLIDNSNLTRIKFTSKDDLSSKIATALNNEIYSLNQSNQLNGWVKRSTIGLMNISTTGRHAIQNLLKSAVSDFIIQNEDIYTYDFDENCSCIIERIRTQYCLSDVTHSMVQYGSDDETSDFEIIEITDNSVNSIVRPIPYIVT